MEKQFTILKKVIWVKKSKSKKVEIHLAKKEKSLQTIVLGAILLIVLLITEVFVLQNKILRFDPWIISLGISGTVILLEVARYFKKLVYRILFWLIFLAAIFLIVSNIISWNNLLKVFSNSVQLDVTYLMLGIILIQTLIFDYGLLNKEAVWLIGIWLAFIVLVAPIVGVNINPGLMTLLIIEAVVFILFSRKIKTWKNVSILLFAGIVLLTISGMVTSTNEGQFYQTTNKLTDQMVSRVLKATGRKDISIESGRVPRGNNYRTDVARLRIVATNQPSEPLYLRDFIGNNYTGDQWTEAEDRKVLRKAAKNAKWQYMQYLDWMFSSIYYNFNRYTNPKAKNKSNNIGIRDLSSQMNHYYVPYWSNYTTNVQSRTNYDFSIFERKDMKINWNHKLVQSENDFYYYGRNNQNDFNSYKKQALNLIKAYHTQADKTYTKFDSKKSPQLYDFIQKTKKQGKVKNLDQITSFIAQVLKRNARYTRSPGLVPLGKDPVDYFLFENHRGYCIQYASAATLMYRMFGIPARYASGYIIQPNEFKKADNGYQSTVTDYQAHAWTEIFLDDYGWVPVDFTPDSTGAIQASYPGFKQQSLNNLTSNLQLNINQQRRRKNNSKRSNGFSFKSLNTKFNSWLITVILVILVMLHFLPMVIYRYGGLSLLSELILKTAQRKLKNYAGFEDDYAEKLAQVFSVDQTQAADIQKILLEDSFGQRKATEDDVEKVRQFWFSLRKADYQVSSAWRKIFLKIWGL